MGGVGLCALLLKAQMGLILPDPNELYMNIVQWWNGNWQHKTKVSATYSITNPIQTTLGFWNCIMTNIMHKFFLSLIYQFTSALHVLGFFLAHLQRQVYNFGVVQVSWVWSQHPGTDTIPNRLEPC
jgi:hypothetical protein